MIHALLAIVRSQLTGLLALLLLGTGRRPDVCRGRPTVEWVP